ncbi:conserved hypothetical protein [Methanococcus aeolicus Nankai-3]|jgi:hypothetical protein|uniref:DUF5320 domain-containing protein n=1 Tax=Methanococcus aeolicus (strain ATCC BAA-1280 / DSM 17508 / OCM 812 / Nankai-3) TaxID=419665 RepID=A6UUA0_META3|nr:hypothetical protein [Methanococcus aeolicus]ABR56072.1 conserved hypothetical protein [Methanococcus aeolicus Nankai-3]
MFGFGRKLGFGRMGRCGGMGRGFRHQAQDNTVTTTVANTEMPLNEKYEYVGACRCGSGAHAYYKAINTGEILHASAVAYGENTTPKDTESKNTVISDRLKRLEEEIKKLKEDL